MKTASRFFWERLALLDRLIRADAYPSAQLIADQLEVSRRTILRDIDMARDRLGMPLVYEPHRRGYRYAVPTYRLAFTSLTKTDLDTLQTAQLALEPFGGLADGSKLEQTTRKITLGMIDSIPEAAISPGKARSFRFSTPSRTDPDCFMAIHDAIQHERRLQIRYYSASSDTESDREVDPYHLVSIDGRWFLVAFCLRHDEIRMFAIGRIRALTATAVHFAFPESFCIKQYLGQSLGMLRGGTDESYIVRLQFRGAAVRYVREQILHPSQVAGPTRGGGWLVQLEVSHLREVERLVLSWGADCVVLDPPELRDQVARTLTLAANQYSNRALV